MSMLDRAFSARDSFFSNLDLLHGLMRFSVGIEGIDDLIADVESALEKLALSV